MDWALYGLFIVSGFAVAAAPGPTVLQIFSHSMSGDARQPASLIAGAIFANALMVLATVVGLSTLIAASQIAFTFLKWLGSGYLIYLGIHYWRSSAEALSASKSIHARPYKTLFFQAALTSLTNPKGILFYVAFLPLFVSPKFDPQIQLAILGVSYIGLCIISDIGYAIAGRSLVKFAMTSRTVRLKNRVTGSILIGAGLSLFRFDRP